MALKFVCRYDVCFIVSFLHSIFFLTMLQFPRAFSGWLNLNLLHFKQSLLLNVLWQLFPREMIKNAAFNQGESRTSHRAVIRDDFSNKIHIIG